MRFISGRVSLGLALAVLASLGLASRAADAPGPRGNASAQDAWLRATPPGATVAAGYLTLIGGESQARLVGASCECAARVELHGTFERDGMMSMRPVAGVDVPARGRVALAPMGTHLMLIGLDAPLVAGQRVRLVLSFADGASVPVEATVRPAGAMPEDADHH